MGLLCQGSTILHFLLHYIMYTHHWQQKRLNPQRLASRKNSHNLDVIQYMHPMVMFLTTQQGGQVPALDVTPLTSIVLEVVESRLEEYITLGSKVGKDVSVELFVHGGEGSEGGHDINDICSHSQQGEKVNQP